MFNLLTWRLVNWLNYLLAAPLSPRTLPLLMSVVRLALGALRALLLVIVMVVILTIRVLWLAVLAVRVDTLVWRCTFFTDLFMCSANLLFSPFLIKPFAGKFLAAVVAGVPVFVSTVYSISYFILTAYVRSLRNRGWCCARSLWSL